MTHVLMVAEQGVPEFAVDGFIDGICHVLQRGGLEGAVGANACPLSELLQGHVFKPFGKVPLNYEDGSVNIDVARVNALNLLAMMHANRYDSFFVAYVSNERFRPMRAAEVAKATGAQVEWTRDDYNFCRASSQQLHDTIDGAIDAKKYKSPLFGAWFLSVPGINTPSAVFDRVDDALVRERAYVLGAHESSHMWYAKHCAEGICVMTSGENDGLIGSRAAVPNQELDRKVEYLRKSGELFWCESHSPKSREPLRDLLGHVDNSL